MLKRMTYHRKQKSHTQRAGPHQNLTVAIMLTVADSKKDDISQETEITHTHTHTQRAGLHQNLTVAIMLTVADAKKNDISRETEITHTK